MHAGARKLRWLSVALLVCARPAAPARSQIYQLDAALGDHDAAIYCDAAFPSSSTLETGDVNGDGVTDLVIGRYGADEYRGHVLVVYGPFIDGDRDLTVDGADVVIRGDVTNGNVGVRLRVADLNLDGADDVLAMESPGIPGGSVHVFFGGSLPPLWDLATTPADVTVQGAPNRAVAMLSAVGHVDEDGYPDVILGGMSLLGTPWHYGILYGRAIWPSVIDLGVTGWDTEIRGMSAGGGGLGGRDCVISDFDGDGHNDLFLGNPKAQSKGRNTGELVVWLGDGGRFPAVLDRNLDLPALVVEGPSAQSWLGDTFVVGDVNGDRLADVVMLAYNSDEDNPEVFVLHGRASWREYVDLGQGADLVLARATAAEGFGRLVDVGDFDGDGIVDIGCTEYAAPGPGDRSSAGRALVFFGQPDVVGTYTEATYPRVLYLWGADPIDYLGLGENQVFRDLDLDGFADLVIPVARGDGPGNAYAASNPGDILVLKGRPLAEGCDIWRDDSLGTIGPPRPDLASLLPLGPEDCHRLEFAPGSSDPDAGILSDASRPLVFYATPRPTAALHVVKRGGNVVIEY